MAVKDLFAYADYNGDRNQALNQLHKTQQIQSALNKNWQDALTFDSSTQAINAQNQLNKELNAEKLSQAKGLQLYQEALARNLYDKNGERVPLHEAHQKSAAEVASLYGFTPHARNAIINQYTGQTEAISNFANQAAPFNPSAAANAKIGLLSRDTQFARAVQNPDGSMYIGNTQPDGTQTLTYIPSYNQSALFAYNPTGYFDKQFAQDIWKEQSAINAQEQNQQTLHQYNLMDRNNQNQHQREMVELAERERQRIELERLRQSYKNQDEGAFDPNLALPEISKEDFEERPNNPQTIPPSTAPRTNTAPNTNMGNNPYARTLMQTMQKDATEGKSVIAINSSTIAYRDKLNQEIADALNTMRLLQNQIRSGRLNNAGKAEANAEIQSLNREIQSKNNAIKWFEANNFKQ